MKSVGGALFMGQCAAINVIGHMGIDTQPDTESRFSPVMLSSFPSIMYLAIGKNAVSLGPDGSVESGEVIHETLFADDLGLESKHVSHYSLFENADIMKESIVSWSFVAPTIRQADEPLLGFCVLVAGSPLLRGDNMVAFLWMKVFGRRILIRSCRRNSRFRSSGG